MLRQILTASALLLPAAAFAQTADFQPCETPQYAGTYVMATGELIPPSGTQGSTKATPGVIYNNNAGSGFFATLYNDSVAIDEGRIPSTSAPEGGVRNSYLVTAFQFGYCTRELDVSLGGLGAEANVFFWEDYNDCDDLATAGTPLASFNLAGLPASTALGSLSCWIIDIDLTGFEFCIKADADGVYDGDQDLDGFGYGLQLVNQIGGSGTSWGGFLITGDPALAPAGDGTYYQNPGATAGTGLDNDDLYYREGGSGQTSGCFFFGGAPFAGSWMQITADLDDSTCVGLDCNGNGIDDLFDIQGGTSLDCNGNGVPDECETDCNGNGVPDDCDIAGLFSLDVDGNGVPDECEPGAGTPYCFGVGCPCGNDDPGAGCLNSTGLGGLLYSFGGASVGADDTELYGTHLPANTVGIFVMGTAQLGGGLGLPAFDGLACVGGTTRRFPASFVGPDGTVGLLGPAGIYPQQIVAGSTWNFMFWYRNTNGSPCGTGANFTNAVQLDFVP